MRRQLDRPTIAMAAVLVAVAALAVVAVRLDGTPPVADPGTPDAAVQDFVQASLDGDLATAEAMLASGVDCDVWWPRDPTRVSLVSTSESGGTALVDVLVTVSHGQSLLGPNESTWEDTFQLVSEDGNWKVERAPWPFGSCGGGP